MARRVDELDGLFHHVQQEVKTWSRRQNRQIAQGGAQAKVELLEATLHHLMYDVGVKGAHSEPERDEPSTATEEAPPPESATLPPPDKP